MIITTKAIVFSALKYSEADLIVTCFTEAEGVKTYLLRGILKSKKGKLRTSYFQPLTQLEIVAAHKNKGTLESIREAKVIHTYKTLHTQVTKGAIVIFLSEILKNTIKEEEKNGPLFQYLENAFIWLDENDAIANFHILFLLKLSAYLGFYPDASNISAPYFNLQDGFFQKSDTNNYCQEGKVVEALKAFFEIPFDSLKEIQLSKTLRAEVLNMVLVYYQLHVQGYKKPKSLEVLNQIFQ